MLEVRQVRKAFGERRVLRGVDLGVGPGQILGLVGANGAGKTTLISIVAGLLPADGGRVRVCGEDARAWGRLRGRGSAAGSLGLAPQRLGVYPTLTVGENLTCFARLLGMPRRQVRPRAEEVAGLVGLHDQWGQRTEELSGGQQRRLHTGMAVLHHPRLLFLDEPTVGADVQSRAMILQIVRDLAAQGTAVVYTTHYLTELEQLDAGIAVLDGGVIVERGRVDEVVGRWGRASVRLRFDGRAPELDGWTVEGTAGDALVPEAAAADPGAAAAAALNALGSRASALIGVDVTRPSLESAYLAITGHALSEEDGDVVAA
jgi:ABC-2 type transport system ATP-binding protein